MPHSGSKRNRILPALVIPIFVASYLTAQESPAPSAGKNPQTGAALLQEKTRQWIEARQLLGKESAAWTEEMASLEELNAIREKETAQLGEFIDAAGARVEELAGKTKSLSEESVALKSWRAKLETDLSSLEAELKPLLPRFPPVLREKMEESLLRIESPDLEAPLQNRARDVLLVLQACLEFQNAVTVASEVREIAGQRREVEVLYVGITQAWYVDPTNQFSGQGIPGDSGWTWNEDNRIATQVRSAIEVQTRRSVPAFVELPLDNGKEEER